MNVTGYENIMALPVGTIATVKSGIGSNDWVKTIDAGWSLLSRGYTQDQVDAALARPSWNISPCNSGDHAVLNPEFVIAALLKNLNDSKRATQRAEARYSSSAARLQQIEEFINGDHECEAAL